MGLLKHVLFWPVTGPSFLTRFSLGSVHDVVRDELVDDTPVKEALLELQLQLEAGEIDDDEYMQMEGELMARLREVRQWREEFGMGVSGGPVRVAAEPSDAADVSEGGASDAQTDAAGEGRRGGIASPSGAEIELNFDE